MNYKRLEHIQIEEINLYGSKAVNLATMIQHDINVPEGYAISTAFTTKVVAQNYTLDDEDVRLLKTVYSAFNNKAVAVRSSGALEDLGGESFAGQYDTVLDIVDYQQFEAAVISCVRSSFSVHASDYSRNQAGEATAPIALIVQEMVLGEASGVMFTANPLSQNREEIVITAGLSYGFGVMDGTSDLEKVTITKTMPVAIIDRTSAINKKNTQSVLSRDIILTEQVLTQLHDLAEQIETLMGYYQDIEWVLKDDTVHILQTRAITTLYPIEEEHLGGDKLRLYLCYNSIIQGMTDPYTPLGYDFTRLTFAAYTSIYYNGKKKDLYPTWIRNINGRLHYDLTELLGRRFIGKSFLSSLDTKDPDGGILLKALYQKHRKTFLKQGGAFKLSMALVRWGMSLNKFGKISRTNIDKALEEAKAMGEDYLRALETRITKAKAKENLIQLLEDVTEELLTLSFRQIMYISYALKAYDKWEKWLKKHYPDIDLGPVQLAVANNPTTEMGLAMMKASIRLNQSKEEPDSSHPEIEALLNVYGHRSDHDTDMGVKRWYETPEKMVHMIKHYMMDDLGQKALDRYELQSRDAKVLIENIYEKIKMNQSEAKAKQFKFDMDNYRTLIGLRELPKFNVVKAQSMLRKQFLLLAEDYVKKGYLDEAVDISYLTIKDISSIESIDSKQLVADRKDRYKEQCHFTKVPRFIMSTGEVHYNRPLEASDIHNKHHITGTPLSAGRITGTVRILTSPFEAPIGADEILVTHNTDPSWTPLFPTIKGLIMESGGPISHGAIVAREYGLPAIGGVTGAVDRLQDGDKIEMDGATGLIVIMG